MSTLSLVFLCLFLLTSSLVLLSLPLDRLDVWLKAISGILAGLTVMVGFWAFFTGEKLSDMQKERIAALEKQTAEARARQADAERDVEQMRIEVFDSRSLEKEKADRARETLRQFANSSVVIKYAAHDWESHGFAADLYFLLKSSGWSVEYPEPSTWDLQSGVHLVVGVSEGRRADEDPHVKKLSEVLADILEIEHIGVATVRYLPAGALSIEVGKKF